MNGRSWLDEHAFPYTRERVYLDTAATGLASTDASKVAAGFYRNALSRGFDAHEEWQSVARDLATSIASFIGAPDAQVDFFSSTTHALNLVAQGMCWKDDDEVVFAADDHLSVREPWCAVPGGQARARPIAVPVEKDRESLLLGALNARTRVLAVSHVHSRSGTRLDLQTLAKACRANGTLLVVDGIQGVGAIPVEAHDVDVYCAATFKWLLSGFGLAFLATSERARKQLHPAYRGYRNASPSEALQYSHLNYPTLYVLQRSLSMFEKEHDRIYDRIAELTQTAKRGMRDRGETVLTPEAVQQSAGIVSVKVADNATAQTIRSSLDQRRISVAAKDDVVRISPHFYNSPVDIDTLLQAWDEIRADKDHA